MKFYFGYPLPKANKLFSYLFAISLALPFFAAFTSQIGLKETRELFKVSLALLFLYSLYWSIRREKLHLTYESILFIFFSPLAFTTGLLDNGINQATLPHLFTAIIPIFGISLGYDLAKRNMFETSIETANKQIYLVCLLMLPLYYYLHKAGLIYRLGITAPVFFLSAYFLVTRQYVSIIACFILVLLTGKRIYIALYVLQCSLFVLVYLSRALVTLKAGKLVSKFVLFLMFWGVLAIAIIPVIGPDFIRDFEIISLNDLSNMEQLNEITSGRVDYLTSLIAHLRQEGSHWGLGSGFGEMIEVYFTHSDSYETKAYPHSSLGGYLLIYGLVFTLLLFGGFVQALVIGFYSLGDKYVYLVFFCFFLLTISGANLMVDPLGWVFFGALRFYLGEGKQQMHLPRY